MANRRLRVVVKFAPNFEGPNLTHPSVLVQQAIEQFDQFSIPTKSKHKRLCIRLQEAIIYYWTGLSCGKQGYSDDDVSKLVFVASVREALTKAGLKTPRTRGGWYFEFLKTLAGKEVDLPDDLMKTAIKANKLKIKQAKPPRKPLITNNSYISDEIFPALTDEVKCV